MFWLKQNFILLTFTLLFLKFMVIINPQSPAVLPEGPKVKCLSNRVSFQKDSFWVGFKSLCSMGNDNYRPTTLNRAEASSLKLYRVSVFEITNLLNTK